MNRELLEKPFAPAQIRQRKGRNGVLDYVEGHSVIARLNQALDGAWSFEITHHEVREDEVLVLGKLTAENVTKMAFGTSQVTRERGTGALISLGDDLKSASTDAMKKCATFLGVGLHLYADKPLGGRAAASVAGNGHGARPPVRPSTNGNAAPSPPPASNNGTARGPHSNGPGVSDRQLDAIEKIGRAKGLDVPAIDTLSLRVFNRKPGQLTQREASELIRQLSNMKRSAV